MIKTYKTRKGLDNAVRKVLGVESKALQEGVMSPGWMSIPINQATEVRYFMIGLDGYPKGFTEDVVDNLEVLFGGYRSLVTLFGRGCLVVDIPLEVSK